MDYRPSTILVNFKFDTSHYIVERMLSQLKLYGISVSQVFNRWAIEVPHGKEKEYQKLFSESSFVEEVKKEFLTGNKIFKKNVVIDKKAAMAARDDGGWR